MNNQIYTTDVLVVGGGTGGTAAAITAARLGAKVILVSEFATLGGMLTSAGVTAPDGNELEAFQTGLWGEFLRELRSKQPGGLDNSWVSFFSYEPRIGAQIFADWVNALPNLQWISGYIPFEVLRQGNCVTGVKFASFTVHAKITIDGTELGDLLALGEIPHRWGWELQSEFGEKSAPVEYNSLTAKYPVQAPTWVVVMQDFGDYDAPVIPKAPNYDESLFIGAWDNYGTEKFMNYGRLPGNRFMMNWPKLGNDWGENLGRLVESEAKRQEVLQESFWHSQNFAHFIQSQLGYRYGLAPNVFPQQRRDVTCNVSTSFALHPYYRESRRLIGITTVCEQDILPVPGGNAAPLHEDAIAIGNYANDHHYPGIEFPLQPKSIRWGGRWTGTPFTIPYRSLVSPDIDGFFACEKNISVSHIASGATRLQPVVMNIGQAVGMAASLCIENNVSPQYLSVKKLQAALIENSHLPVTIVPFFNLTLDHPEWLKWQKYYIANHAAYPISGTCPDENNQYLDKHKNSVKLLNKFPYIGTFHYYNQQDYGFTVTTPSQYNGQTWQLVTLHPHIDSIFKNLVSGQLLQVWGRYNPAGNWLLIEHVEK
ncbi:glucose-inhibited division protein A [Calothrix sp. NIES-4071]|nr:glucose-inhibited division protein A [Calothrix sp. NIES-4071]BAZ59957.1 glucose-inhibited division protein A [Calothrix sp. NIES-4105]